MTARMTTALAAAALIAGIAVTAQNASAMPIAGLDNAVATAADVSGAQIQDTAYVCGPFRCHFVPGGYYAPRPFFRPRFFGGWGRRW